MWLIALGSFIGVLNENILTLLPVGIVALILGCMACPKITNYTEDNEKFDTYTRYKVLIVWVLIVLFIVLLCVLSKSGQW